ncbi:hypothetical protein OUZ56_005001 [Daphnia magna]|uniref:EOG090X02D0 n=1 Tax=Daphnia magna TaxID=35525 RepID=A0ABQ9YRQ1_9CRUS|nr:hypothetical protein OUZ56_005001 [Daphnia magna]
MANISRARSRKRAKGEICHLLSPIDSATSVGEQPLNLCVRDKSLPVLLTDGAVSEEQTPRLQEKKILSLDSGGNFRFFPELQHQQNQEKQQLQQQEQRKQSVIASVTVQQQHNQQVKPIPALLPIKNIHPNWCPPHSLTTKNSPRNLAVTLPSSLLDTNHGSGSRRLSRRQKMEQTFGEKGFLIQTQHVPATEGSAFCKFRQLKKFTRYLYRSWRHYLPDENPSANSPTE